jgi:flagellar biosynthesis protein FlhA
VVVTHLAEVVRSNAGSLLSRQDVQMLVDGLRYDEPILANEVGSDALPLGLLHSVVRRLLDERVSIRDLGPILEVVANRAAETRSVETLAAAARVAVGRAILSTVAPEGRLAVITLDPSLEAALHEGLREVDGTMYVVADGAVLETLRNRAEQLASEAARRQLPAGMIVGQPLRAALQRTIRGMGLDLNVLAYPELPPDLALEPVGVIGAALAQT